MKFIFFFFFFYFPIINTNIICDNNFFNFLIEINKKDILIIEKYSFHGECLPGFIKYFIDLGYNKIDILINPILYKLNPLKNLFNNKLNILVYPSKIIEKFITLGICEHYKICLFNSLGYKKEENLIKYLNKRQKFKKLIVFHNLNKINKDYENIFNIIVLKKFNKTIKSIYEINPHYFGEYKIHNKSKKTFFITNEKAYKKFSIKKKLTNYITFTGRIPYDKMYELISKADFFLPLLDHKMHTKYLKEKTSGSFQLSYGFNIPMIIEKIFSEKYGFNYNNSIIYNSKKDFFNKLKYSIEMENKDYHKLKYYLNIKAKEIEKISIENLKFILNK